VAYFNGWFGTNLFSELNLVKNRTPSLTAAPTNTKILPTSTPTITPTPSKGSTRVSQIDGMKMVFVPAGEFTMGITNGPFTIEGPAHQVYLDAYWIDKTEVTYGMYQKCVYKGACKEKYATPTWDAHPW
jgi:formylglycine-generating enzyme required for sulfatase activity